MESSTDIRTMTRSGTASPRLLHATRRVALLAGGLAVVLTACGPAATAGHLPLSGDATSAVDQVSGEEAAAEQDGTRATRRAAAATARLQGLAERDRHEVGSPSEPVPRGRSTPPSKCVRAGPMVPC
jgi:hypothetical protein